MSEPVASQPVARPACMWPAGCNNIVSSGDLFCRGHYFALPPHIREAVYALAHWLHPYP